ncbi:immunoglobulin lambda-1 light chain-like [Xyrichtys novacula]|nr:immunoglobulin lambda-1 light chain-like [Xyrichtys novacula]
MIFIYCFTLKVLLFAGSSLSVKVTQTPADLLYKPGDTARINCSHDEISYDRILWYKKTNSTLMQFLGYMLYKKGYPEDNVNVTFEGGASKDQNCILIIEKVDLSSSAVYFCAASLHSAINR